MTLSTSSARVDNIRHSLVGLKKSFFYPFTKKFVAEKI